MYISVFRLKNRVRLYQVSQSIDLLTNLSCHIRLSNLEKASCPLSQICTYIKCIYLGATLTVEDKHFLCPF